MNKMAPPPKRLKQENGLMDVKFATKTNPKKRQIQKQEESTAMGNIILRFPHLIDEIFDNLENTSLASCNVVSRLWYNHLKNQKSVHVKIIHSYLQKHHEKVGEHWKRFLKTSNRENIIKLGLAVKNIYGENSKFQAHLEKCLTPLHIAAIHGQLDLCKYIIDRNEDKNPKSNSGCSPMHWAAGIGNLTLMKYIQIAVLNENPGDKSGVTPLHWAAKNGQFEVVEWLLKILDDKYPTDNLGNTPLHWAAYRGHLKICKVIMNEIENKNPGNNNGITPLHRAASEGRFDTCKYIIENVKDKNPRSHVQGDTPLHHAARKGHLDVCLLIMNNTVDRNPRDTHGYTPLHLAAHSGHLEVYKAIAEWIKCSYNFDFDDVINPKSNSGWTPLHEAAIRGQKDVCKYILENVVNKSPLDQEDMTPLDVANEPATILAFTQFGNSIGYGV